MVERDYQKQNYVDTVDFICTLLGRPCSPTKKRVTMMKKMMLVV